MQPNTEEHNSQDNDAGELELSNRVFWLTAPTDFFQLTSAPGQASRVTVDNGGLSTFEMRLGRCFFRVTTNA